MSLVEARHKPPKYEAQPIKHTVTNSVTCAEDEADKPARSGKEAHKTDQRDNQVPFPAPLTLRPDYLKIHKVLNSHKETEGKEFLVQWSD